MKGSSNKRKPPSSGQRKKKQALNLFHSKSQMDEGSSSDDHNDHDDVESESSDDNNDDDNDSEEEEQTETVDSKRIRLAKEYLKRVEEKLSSSDDDDDDSSDEESSDDDDDNNTRDGSKKKASKLGDKLARDRLKRSGGLEQIVTPRILQYVEHTHPQAIHTYSEHLHKEGGGSTITEEKEEEMNAEKQAKAWLHYQPPDNSDSSSSTSQEQQHAITYYRGHDLTPTCVALHSSGSTAYSASKDNSVLRWDVETETGQVQGKYDMLQPQWKNTSREYNQGHGQILALAASDDGRYLAVGGREGLVKVFDVRLSGSQKGGDRDAVASFSGHKGPVTCLAFRSQSLQLFSGSEDRCIRHYSLEEMAYIETLYGHQAAVTSISCNTKERPISTGRDRTVRGWKIEEESHLIFRGGSRATSADCLTQMKEDWFATGHEDGSVALWFTEKKKAVETVWGAHVDNYDADNSASICPMIVSCDALRGSDLLATGSNDGFLRLWKVRTGKTIDERGLSKLAKIPIHGFVNGIAIGPKARFAAVAVGQEHRLGRWTRVARAKNRFAIVKLSESDSHNQGASTDEVTMEENDDSDDDDDVVGISKSTGR